MNFAPLEKASNKYAHGGEMGLQKHFELFLVKNGVHFTPRVASHFRQGAVLNESDYEQEGRKFSEHVAQSFVDLHKDIYGNELSFSIGKTYFTRSKEEKGPKYYAPVIRLERKR